MKCSPEAVFAVSFWKFTKAFPSQLLPIASDVYALCNLPADTPVLARAVSSNLGCSCTSIKSYSSNSVLWHICACITFLNQQCYWDKLCEKMQFSTQMVSLLNSH